MIVDANISPCVELYKPIFIDVQFENAIFTIFISTFFFCLFVLCSCQICLIIARFSFGLFRTFGCTVGGKSVAGFRFE